MERLVRGVIVLLVLLMILPTIARTLPGLLADFIPLGKGIVGTLFGSILFGLFCLGLGVRITRLWERPDLARARQRAQRRERERLAVRRLATEVPPYGQPDDPADDDLAVNPDDGGGGA